MQCTLPFVQTCTRDHRSNKEGNANCSLPSSQQQHTDKMCDIHSLPNECLEQIFLRLPLVTFIRVVPLVSRRWAAVRNAAARLCHRLDLVIPDPEMPTDFICPPELFQVRVDKDLTPKVVRSIVVLFPAIRRLYVWLPYPMQHLAPLLESWSETLITLIVTINGLSADDRRSNDIFSTRRINDPLLNVINTRLLRLRHLEFCDKNYAYYNNDMHLELPVLSRLYRFAFYTRNRIEDLFESLHEYACRNAQLNSIRIQNRIYNNHVFYRLSREFPSEVSVCSHLPNQNLPLSNVVFTIIPSQLLSRFESMFITRNIFSDEQVTAQSILAKFPSLKYLANRASSLNNHAQPLADQMRELCKLEQLEKFYGVYCNRDDQHSSFGEMFGMESSASKTTPRFQSLAHLSLTVWLSKSDDFHSIFDTPQLKYMFPVLQSLEFDFLFLSECTRCGDAYTRMDIFSAYDNMSVRLALGRCAKQIIRPWRCYCHGLQYSQITCHFFNTIIGPLFTMKF